MAQWNKLHQTLTTLIVLINRISSLFVLFFLLDLITVRNIQNIASLILRIATFMVMDKNIATALYFHFNLQAEISLLLDVIPYYVQTFMVPR